MRDAIITTGILFGFGLACVGARTVTKDVSPALPSATAANDSVDTTTDAADNATAIVSDPTAVAVASSCQFCGAECKCAFCTCQTPGICLSPPKPQIDPVKLAPPVWPIPIVPPVHKAQPAGHYEYRRAGLFGRQSYRVWVQDSPQSQTYYYAPSCSGPGCRSCR